MPTLSQSRFRGNRRAVARVLKLCCLSADLDYYTVAELRDLQPEAVLEKTLDWLSEEGVPDPSLALSSGRRLALVWRHTLVSRKRLAEWKAAQNRIYRVLKPFGADVEHAHGAERHRDDRVAPRTSDNSPSTHSGE